MFGEDKRWSEKGRAKGCSNDHRQGGYSIPAKKSSTVWHRLHEGHETCCSKEERDIEQFVAGLTSKVDEIPVPKVVSDDVYEDTIEWLFQQETMGIKFGLSNETELLGHLGDPHLKFRSVHVAGTNGKGSVCAMTSSVLREAGYRTGLYTSPHLVDFKERINVDGECIPEHEFLRLAEEVREISDRMSATSKEKRLTFFRANDRDGFRPFCGLRSGASGDRGRNGWSP